MAPEDRELLTSFRRRGSLWVVGRWLSLPKTKSGARPRTGSRLSLGVTGGGHPPRGKHTLVGRCLSGRSPVPRRTSPWGIQSWQSDSL